MKKIKLILGILFVSVLSLSYVACSSNDDQDISQDGSNTVNNLEKEYFTVENATYVDQAQPKGTVELLSGFNVNKTVVNGGAAILTLTSNVELAKANISVKGLDGYYEVPLAQSTTRATVTAYEYSVILNMIQNANTEKFAISVSVEAIDGTVSAISASDSIAVIEVGTGELQVSLAWDQYDDLDLFVITPDSTIISYYNMFYTATNDEYDYEEIEFSFHKYVIKQETGEDLSDLTFDNGYNVELVYDKYLDILYSEEAPDVAKMTKLKAEFINSSASIYGALDIDSNAACYIDSLNNENIYFPKAINGTYTVAVNLFEKCNKSRPGSKYAVSVNYRGQSLKISDSQIGQYADDLKGNSMINTGVACYVAIGAFTVTDGIDLPATRGAKTRISSVDLQKRQVRAKIRSVK